MEIELISAYLVSDNAYKEMVKDIFKRIIESGFDNYKLIVRWAQKSSFPEFETIIIYIENEKYTYKNDSLIKQKGCNYSNFVLQCINAVEKGIEKAFYLMQHYCILNRNVIHEYVKLSMQNLIRQFSIGSITIIMPFAPGYSTDEIPYGEAYYKDIHIKYEDCIKSSMNIFIIIGGILVGINKIGEIYEQL